MPFIKIRLIFGQNVPRYIPRHFNPCTTVTVLSLHNALPVRRSPPYPSPCPLPTDLLYTALFTTEKTPISQIPDADCALSLAADLRWPTGFHFDRRLQFVASPDHSKPNRCVVLSLRHASYTYRTRF